MVGKVVALVALLAVVSGAQGRQLLQGTNNTGSSSSVVVRWAVPANGVIDAVRVPLGGNVTFSWTGQHNLWEIPSAQCPSAFTNSSTVRQLAPTSTGGSLTIPYNTTRVYYYSCSVSNHCSQGQLIAVRVNGAALAPSPAPGGSRASAPATRADGAGGYSGNNASPGYAGGASSNYGSASNASSSGTSSGSSGYGADGVNNTPGYSGGSSSSYSSGSGSGK